MDCELVQRTWGQPEQGVTLRLCAPPLEGAEPCVPQHNEQDCLRKGSARHTSNAHYWSSPRIQASTPNLAHKCKTSRGHSTISPVSHKVNEFLLDIIQIAHQASMVPYNIATLRIHGALKSCTPSVNRLGSNLKIICSTVKRDTIFLHSPINKVP